MVPILQQLSLHAGQVFVQRRGRSVYGKCDSNNFIYALRVPYSWRMYGLMRNMRSIYAFCNFRSSLGIKEVSTCEKMDGRKYRIEFCDCLPFLLSSSEVRIVALNVRSDYRFKYHDLRDHCLFPNNNDLV